MIGVAIIIVVAIVFGEIASVVDGATIVFISVWGNQGLEQRGHQGAINM